jgi:hypothetical protein
LIFATTFAARLTLQELHRTGTTEALWDRMTQFEEFNRLIGFKELDRLQAAYEMAEAEAVR